MRIGKVLKTICITVLVLSMSFPAYARQQNINVYTDISVVSKLLPPSVKESYDYITAITRGNFFAAADLKITNEKGEIGVTAHSYLSYAVDELYMTIYVDRWIEKENRWNQVAYYDFEFYGKDYPDGLTSETVEFIIDNQPKGNYYRLRGTYAAIKDGEMEGFGPATDGVLIE